MHVMSKSPLEREHTMTETQLRTERADWKALLGDDADLMREIVRAAVTEILEVEMTEALGAERGERSETRLGYRVNEEIRRRTRVVRIFPNQASCLRLVSALAVETHEGWLEEHRYLNMALLVEQRKEQMRMLEEAAA
jgi:transposase-like protein